MIKRSKALWLRSLLIFTTVLLTAFVPAPSPTPSFVKSDFKALQGRWLWVSTKKGGKESPAPLNGVVYVIDGERAQRTVNRKIIDHFTVVLGGTRASRTIDFDFGDEILTGLYRLEGDILKISFGNPRPSDLSGNNPVYGVIILKRQKP